MASFFITIRQKNWIRRFGIRLTACITDGLEFEICEREK